MGTAISNTGRMWTAAMFAVIVIAALVMAVGMGCVPTQTVSSKPAAPAPGKATPPAPAVAVPAPATRTAPAAKTAAADELDVAIRDASDCLNDNIPKGSKIVILNIESNSANLAEYIIDELIANAINDKNFSVVDRRQLEAIQSEQKFQMSGAVADKDALAIGQFFGAQTIVSGAMREMGGRYRMTVRALAVQTALVQSQCNQNIAIAASATLTDLVNSGGSRPTSGATATTGGRTTQAVTTTPATQAKTAVPAAEPPIQGIAVPGNSLEEKLAWLTRSADSHNTYILEVNADETIAPHTFEFRGGINITVVLRGVGGNRTIRLRSNGTMFTIGDNVTFILDNNITLQGHSGNNAAVVNLPYISHNGIFRMKTGSVITGNVNDGDREGGGVRINSGAFEMTGGIISGNTATAHGGGVSQWGGTFTMTDGTISGNIASSGGGVMVAGGTFTMRGGTITGNTANYSGGGVAHSNSSSFAKSGGTITGYSSDQTNGNAVRATDGYILARKGHAVFAHETIRKETTVGPNVNLSVGGSKGKTGAWDQ